MKATASILTIAIVLLFISCEQRNEKNDAVGNRNDTVKTLADTKVQERLQARKQMEEQERIDSINDDKALREALEIAEQHKAQHHFKKKYLALIPDSSYQVEVEIRSGSYFSSKFPHLIIRRKAPGSVYIDIFSKTNNQFQKVLSHEQWIMEYTGDTIRDINGDGLKDFVVDWYGSNGCCLKAFSNVYLQRSDRKSFSGNFEFINPTFSPKEHIVRGLGYGHPGQTEMYKYKWNKEAVDTIEYIYYEKNDKGEKTGKLIASNDLPYSDNQKFIKRLNQMPAEYKKIEGYDWFTAKLDGNR
jgi:hypothetical protein